MVNPQDCRPKAIIAKHTTEAEFQRDVIALAQRYGWKVAHFRPAQTTKGWRTPMSGDPGWPDLVLARNGVVHHWELKREDGVVTDVQQAWIVALRGRILRPSDWDRICEILE